MNVSILFVVQDIYIKILSLFEKSGVDHIAILGVQVYFNF